MKSTFLIILFCSLFQMVKAQDLEALVKARKKPVKVSGGVGTDHVFYESEGISARRNLPYQYYFNGNVNFTFFNELHVPISFSYSNQHLSYSQPINQQQFNQFGMSPRYKWVTGHFGWRSMTFSPYSLNGHTFLGGGLELKPGNFHISAMYGRLLKPVEFDSIQVALGNKPSFERYAMAVSGKYEKDGNTYGFNFLRSSDNIASIEKPLDSMGVTPEDNFVWSALLKQKISSKLTLEGEYANSAITKDTRYQDETPVKYLGIITTNSTTVSYQAYKAKASYQIGKSKIGAGYERVDPGYRTHGAYYFNNDLENITASFSTQLLKGKINFSIEGGTQRNNLDKSKISTMKRWVGNSTLAYQVSKKLNMSVNYSNFQSYTNMRSPLAVIVSPNPYQNIDTLNYVQVSQSVGLMTNWNMRSDEKLQQTFIINANVQKAGEEQGNKRLPTGTSLYNINTSYSHAFVPIGLSFQFSFNMNSNVLATATVLAYGPSLGATKQLFKKALKLNLTYTWNTTETDQVRNGYIGNLKFTNTLTIKKKHNATLSFVWLDRQTLTLPMFQEYTMRVGYNYRF